MTATITRPGVTVAPVALQNYKASRAARTVIHDVLNSTNPDVSFRAFGLRAGELSIAFDNAAAAHAAHAALSVERATFTLSDIDVPNIGMRFVVAGGDLDIEQDTDVPNVWYITIPFQEVAP